MDDLEGLVLIRRKENLHYDDSLGLRGDLVYVKEGF